MPEFKGSPALESQSSVFNAGRVLKGWGLRTLRERVRRLPKAAPWGTELGLGGRGCRGLRESYEVGCLWVRDLVGFASFVRISFSK